MQNHYCISILICLLKLQICQNGFSLFHCWSLILFSKLWPQFGVNSWIGEQANLVFWRVKFYIQDIIYHISQDFKGRSQRTFRDKFSSPKSSEINTTTIYDAHTLSYTVYVIHAYLWWQEQVANPLIFSASSCLTSQCIWSIILGQSFCLLGTQLAWWSKQNL